MRAKLCAVLTLVVALLFSAPAEARGCHEVSDIVGEQHCTTFGGGWSVEHEFPILFRFGTRYSELSTANTEFKEEIGKQSRPPGYEAYRYPGEALGVGSLSTLGVQGGFEFFVYGQLYTGFDGSFAFGSVPMSSFTTASGVKLSADDGLNVTVFHGGTPIGYRIPLGRAALRPEVMTGIAVTEIDHRVDAKGLPSTGSASEIRVLVEPRIHADIWFTQHISFGAYAGVNVLDGDARSHAFGLSLAWHNRSFDGDTSF